MARPESIQIVRHVPLDGLDGLMRGSKMNLTPAQIATVERNLCFIRMRYNGFSVEQAASAVGITKPTGFRVQGLWNESGFEGIIPGYSGGRKPRLSEEQTAALADRLASEPMSTRSVRLYVRDEFGVDYSEKQIHVILGRMGMRHAKPYPQDRKRPSDAEDVLKKDSGMLWFPPEAAISS